MLAAVAALALAAGVVVGSGPGEDERGSASPLHRVRLDLWEQVGQLLVSSFDGSRLPPYLRRRLRAGQTSGVILFGKNAPSAAGLRALTREVQAAARGRALVAIDQEGGPIRSAPFAGPADAQPDQGPPARVQPLAAEAARRLRALGVNVNLAPVADVAVAGSVMAARAFPGPPPAVAAATGASVRGHRRGRVAATVKHFPGLGPAARNTDDAEVTIRLTRAALQPHLAPFRAAVAERAPLVMASHATYPALDRKRIASQSPAVLRSLLRGRLGFEGAVVTDSLEAEAVIRRSSVALAAERSIAAGADLVLMTGSASWKLVFPHLVRAARRSERFRARVEEAAARVVDLKAKLGLTPFSR